MRLVVDVGNSRIKWARVDESELRAGVPVEREEPVETRLTQAWRDMERPARALVCSVAGPDFDQRLERWMASRLHCRPEWFRSEPETLGIINGYADHRQLGSDRWAVLLGAREVCDGPIGVIDCGTALTLDVVDATDHHLGGLIIPGPDLARQSLLSQTANIREAGARPTELLGRTTAECVANGISVGLAGALQRWITEAEKMLDGIAWHATGGAWPELSPIIEATVRYDPDLVLRGLVRAMEHKHPQ